MTRTVAVCCVMLASGLAVSSAQAGDPGGGAAAPQPPAITRVACVPLGEAPCRPRGALLRGRQFVVRGTQLSAVATIVFEGGRGRSDDVRVRPDSASQRNLVAAVPEQARSGRLTVRDRYGNSTIAPRRVHVADAPRSSVDVTPSSRFFFGGRRKPSFSFDVKNAGPVEVQLANAATGEVVKTWTVQSTPGGTNRVVWDGRGTSGIAGAGTYTFGLGAGTAAAASQAPETEASFAFADHLFPIRGRHNLGYTATNGFGGGRGHKGQDMFARCGTRLAAARGGRVEYAGYQAAAGYYAVIDGAGTGVDYVYMHMRAPALVKSGERVFTGQQIGEAGETGRATGCHLHFEMWSSPGWYKGGRPFDPLPSLKRWDSYS